MSTNAELSRTPHDADFFTWSRDQARLLRTLRASCRDVPSALDLDNIAEEIEDLGRAELHAVESGIRNILVHLLKAASMPSAQPVAHWRTEATTFHADLVQRFAPSMRQRVDGQRAWRLAQRIARDALREDGDEIPADLPASCPFPLDELVSEDFDFDRCVEQLARAATAHAPS